MHAVIRGAIVYLALLLIFRVAGKRTLAQTTPFELVLLLILSETIQQAIVHNDQSLTTGLLLVCTLVGLSIALSLLKQKFPAVDLWLDGQPLVLIEGGQMRHERMEKSRVDESDILESARMQEGVERLEQIEYAVMERSGDISVVPKTVHEEMAEGSGAVRKGGSKQAESPNGAGVPRRSRGKSGSTKTQE